MDETTGDAAEAGKEQQQTFEKNDKMWLGGILQCFSSVITKMGEFHREPELPWELPFEALTGLSYLGAGAQGVVFSGQLNGEIVAIKKVRNKWETSLKHLRKLNHENVVRFRGICVDPVCYCLIMEYCQYGSLFQFLHSENNLLPSQLMKWAKEISQGMAYLHSNKIVHRDLKSPNILLSDNLVVKVSDFGTSREWDNKSTVMSFNGTVAWMAPEVIRHGLCSERVDVWAFGVVLWEMMTRELPFKNLEPHAIMWGVGSDTLSLPIPSGCPNTIQVLICQCWQRIPRSRPPFKIIMAHLEMATPDIIAIEPNNFAERQAAWGAEVRDSMAKIFARNNRVTASTPSPPQSPVETPKPREELHQVKELYEQQIRRASELFMEVCAVRLQLEQREQAVAEREKLLKACRCSQRKNVKVHVQQSTTSSEGKPIIVRQPRKKPETQTFVKYIDRDEGMTYTIAVKGRVRNHAVANQEDSIKNNNVQLKKDTILEQNGNVLVPGKKLKAVTDNSIVDVTFI